MLLILIILLDIILIILLFKVIKLRKSRNNIINNIKSNSETKNSFSLIQSRKNYNKFLLIYGIVFGLFISIALRFFFDKHYIIFITLFISIFLQLLSLYFRNKFIKTYVPQNKAFKELFDHFLKSKYIIYILFPIIDVLILLCSLFI